LNKITIFENLSKTLSGVESKVEKLPLVYLKRNHSKFQIKLQPKKLPLVLNYSILEYQIFDIA